MGAKDLRVKAEDLKTFMKAVFEKAGFTPEGAENQADVLVWANLRGVDSHGVQRISWYLELVDKGHMKPRPNIQIQKETPAVLLIDADYAPGPVVTVLAMRKVIEKARKVGIGWAVIRNTLHQGAMGYYSLMAANEGMAGIAIVCNPPNTAPHGARAAGVHNSPIAICVPGKRHKPLMLDMATSVAARGKLDVAEDKGIAIPLGWALDKDGKPTTDPKASTVLLPAGGGKGSGLAMLFECLTSLFVANPATHPRLPGKAGRPGAPAEQRGGGGGHRHLHGPRAVQGERRRDRGRHQGAADGRGVLGGPGARRARGPRASRAGQERHPASRGHLPQNEERLRTVRHPAAGRTVTTDRDRDSDSGELRRVGCSPLSLSEIAVE